MGAEQAEVSDGRTYLHLRMQPVSPRTYQPPGDSVVNSVLTVIGFLVLAFGWLMVMSLVVFALIAPT